MQQAVRQYPPYAVASILRRPLLYFVISCMSLLIGSDGAVQYRSSSAVAKASGDQEAAPAVLHFHSMFGWGDSLTDTGNSLIVTKSLPTAQTLTQGVQGRPPYGETFFGRPVGRFCDGRLLVDLLAEQLGASDFLQPSLAVLNGSNAARTGAQNLVNFAVAGATALSEEYFHATFNITPYTPYSLDSQLGWFSNLSISQNEEALSDALIFFGGIGGNDYNYVYGNRIPLDTILDLVPRVISQLQNAFEFLVGRGVKYMVVQGDYPMGCNPLYKHVYANATKDGDGCLEDINRVIHSHNARLRQLLQEFALLYPNVSFLFWDSETAYMQVYRNPSQYGFAYKEQPCYDIRDYFLGLSMNLTSVEICEDPSSHISWDGPHFTEAMNKVLLTLFYTQGYAQPYPNFLSSSTLH